MIPFSYNTVGFTAIIIMVIILSINELAKYLRQKYHRPDHNES
jgi:hypothetical protein